MYSTAIHATQSGELLEVVKPAGGSWVRGQISQREHVFPLDDDGFDRARRHELFQEWDRTLVVRWNGLPVYAGLITELPYRRRGRLLTVNHIDLRELLKRRHLFGVPFYNPKGEVAFAGQSLAAIAKELLRLGLVEPYSEWWPVPVRFLPVPAGPAVTRTYYHYEFKSIHEMISSLTNEDGGPDIDLHPVYDAGERLVWEARIGGPYLSGPTFDVPELDPSLDGGAETSEQEARSGLRMGTGVFVLGKGGEQDMRVAQVTDFSPGLSKDWVISAKTVDDLTQLQSLGLARLRAQKTPTKQRSLTLQTTEVPPDMLRIGSMIRSHTRDDPWWPDGTRTGRVLTYGGDVNSDTINVTLEEE